MIIIYHVLAQILHTEPFSYIIKETILLVMENFYNVTLLLLG